eukprot:scaffold31075_cov59-Phaeocystis_antarctica.AAC.2
MASNEPKESTALHTETATRTRRLLQYVTSKRARAAPTKPSGAALPRLLPGSRVGLALRGGAWATSPPLAPESRARILSRVRTHSSAVSAEPCASSR